MRLARSMAVGWALHFKQESRNPFFLWIVICTPLIYATMAYFLFRGGTAGDELVGAAVGAGVNVPLDLLPGWLSTIAQGLPVTHGVEAARELVAGGTLTDVAPLLGAELLVGVAYAAVGLFLVRLFEVEARRGASLELA